MRPLAFLAVAACLVPARVIAGPLDAVPPELRPWAPWVLHGHERETCPTFPADGMPRCAWPGRLELRLTDAGGSFEQAFTLLAEDDVALPGERERWPLEVRASGRAVAPLDRDGVPFVRLGPGVHSITGAFEWSTLPESLAVPTETGLVALQVRGGVVVADRSQDGRLRLAARSAPVTEEESLQLAVHRLVVDDVPLLMTTRLLLEISGAAREVALGPALPPDAIPVSLDSPLPARLEADGRLRLQARAGSWIVTLVSRQPGRVSAIAPPAAEAWAADEVWCVQARPDLRVVSIEGVPALDPSQTSLPEEWKRLPTFRVATGDEVRLVERQRGEAAPSADAIALQRELWLDFDGGGLTARDRLSGELRRSWRLQMGGEPPSFVLGRATVAGEPQLLTRLPGEPPDTFGFEIRQGLVDVVAESRLHGPSRTLRVVGWDGDVDSVSATLNLPPGWRLLHASGADRATGSWIDSWTLMDLFLALVVAAAAARTWGWRGGALALAAMALTIPEHGAPRWSWLVLLACAGIERLLAPGGRPRRALRLARLVVAAGIAIVLVPFVVRQARQALHPQLERPWSAAARYGSAWSLPAPAEAGMEVDAETAMRESRAKAEEMAQVRLADKVLQREVHDPSDMVQVGAGVPEWTWRRHELAWSGPVTRDQRLTLFLLPPLVMRLLSALTLLVAMALLVRGLLPPDSVGWTALRRREGPGGDAAPAAVLPLSLLLALVAAAAPARAVDVPPPEILAELRQRLLERPACEPSCASMPRMLVDVAPDTLRLRVQALAAAPTAVPLPGSASSWMPETALVDGQPARVVSGKDGVLWLFVDEGPHDIELAGRLPLRDTVSLPLPLRPARATVRAQGWVVSGVSEGVPAGSLQLSRVRRDERPAGDGTLAPAPLPPLVRVVRRLDLGLRWQVTTSVHALAPTALPVVLRVPTLPGEAVTSSHVQVADGHVIVNLPPGRPSLTWSSALVETESLTLAAPEGTDWTEEWVVAASPRWHVEWTGIPPVHSVQTPPMREPAWRPWPGESVALAITRPEAAPGSSLTFTSSRLDLAPGRRATDATLTLSVLSSRGGDQEIVLPDEAVALSVMLDDLAQPIRQQGARVALPVAPGAHRVAVTWREPRGISARHVTSAVDLGGPSANASIALQVPPDRWILWTSGPRLGPAVLFWPLLAVLLLLGLGLSRLPDIPLRVHDWMLLFVGLSQVPVAAGAAVVAWLLLLAWRRRHAPGAPAALFDLAQVLVVVGALVSVGVLFAAINQGLLGSPDMQVEGNGSSGLSLAWYGDRASGPLPLASVLSAPLLVYRLAMLSWALWLAAALVRWMRWAWTCFTEGGAWRRPWPRRAGTPVVAATASAGAPIEAPGKGTD